ncbi:MAG TPA: exopolyphosphatase [Spirochaetia bacterium]|nr:MAG: hypothetical protein A2Y41_08835 [Spirochaetes bacterium GWB1_36_13]HCL57319.1 exopolyphosphatase [Spirochaetia bacterium]
MDIQNKQYKVLTRGDFDGIVCAALLKEIQMVKEVSFVHPKDMLDGKIEVSGNDIIADLPYHPNAHFVFDYHYRKSGDQEIKNKNFIVDEKALSTSRVVYNHFKNDGVFSGLEEELLDAVDKANAGYFTMEDVLYPKRWEMLNFLLDPRTGLGRFKDFKLSYQEFILKMTDWISRYPVEKILEMSDVLERTQLYESYQEKFQEQILSCAAIQGNLVILDLRKEEMIYPGNRFMIYALFPTCNLSMYLLNSYDKKNTVITLGKSIFKRTSLVNLQQIMAFYGGSAHQYAGECQVENAAAEKVFQEIAGRVEVK